MIPVNIFNNLSMNKRK